MSTRPDPANEPNQADEPDRTRRPASRPQPVTPYQQTANVGYPSLAKHLSTERPNRRMFLQKAGAMALAAGLLPACQRALGAGDADAEVDADADLNVGADADTDAGDPGDATTGGNDGSPDAQARLPGGEQWPDYFTVRIPGHEDLDLEIEGGWRYIFHVDAATADEDAYLTLRDDLPEAADRCAETLRTFTHQELGTLVGFAEAEDTLLETLDQLVMEREGHERSTVEAVALHISSVDQYYMPGAMRRPGWPR
jgi:hypothetical protein